MRQLILRMEGAEFRASLLEDRAPRTIAALVDALPADVTLLQEEWSGALLKGTEPVLSVDHCEDPAEPYQAPGQLYMEAETGSLALCYGLGRLQDGLRPLPTIPVAELLGGIDDFAEVCRSVQFRGAAHLRLELATETADTKPAPAPGTRVRIRFADTEATAILNEAACPDACAALVELLPLTGFATNTHSSGPLVRFWNGDGGSEGETPLPLTPSESAQQESVLLPGSIYYLPKVGFRGFRIPFRHPTMMRSAVRGGGLDLVRIAWFDGDWSGFRQAASRLRRDGALPMELVAGR